MYSPEPFKVILVTILASLVVEALNFLFVYRRAAFKSVKSDVLVVQGKIDALKAKGNSAKATQLKKLEDRMTMIQANLYIFRMQTMFVQFVLLAGAWRLMSNHYKGVPLARLPFKPFKFVTRMTHASLPGEDYSELGFHGIYVLSSMMVRGLVTKFVNKTDSQVLASQKNTLLEKYQESWAEAAKAE